MVSSTFCFLVVLVGVSSQFAFVCSYPIANVKDFGAVGDGKTSDTSAVRKAADSLASAGGGILLFPPPGKYLTGGFNLSANVVMNVTTGATVLGSGKGDDYPLIPPLPWYGCDRDCTDGGCKCDLMHQALIHSQGADNITITGGGLIDGGGSAWWPCVKHYSDAPCYGYARPHLVMLVKGSGVVIRHINIINSPSWTLHLSYLDNVLVEWVNINNPSDSPNTDGMDIDCSQNVVVQNCNVSVGDDIVSFKSGIDWFGRTYGRPTKNVVYQDINGGSGHGLALGSENSGGLENITIRRVYLDGTERGPRIKTQRGRGGVITDIIFEDIIATRLQSDLISFTDNYHKEPVANASATPHVSNILVRNVTFLKCDSYSMQLDGLSDSQLVNVTFDGVTTDNKDVSFKQCDYVSDSHCTGDNTVCPPCFSN